MATEQYKRTTLKLKAETYRRLKRSAIDRDKTLQALVDEAIDLYLRRATRARPGRFESFRMGRIKGRLTRDEIYSD